MFDRQLRFAAQQSLTYSTANFALSNHVNMFIHINPYLSMFKQTQ